MLLSNASRVLCKFPNRETVAMLNEKKSNEMGKSHEYKGGRCSLSMIMFGVLFSWSSVNFQIWKYEHIWKKIWKSGWLISGSRVDAQDGKLWTLTYWWYWIWFSVFGVHFSHSLKVWGNSIEIASSEKEHGFAVSTCLSFSWLWAISIWMFKHNQATTSSSKL